QLAVRAATLNVHVSKLTRRRLGVLSACGARAPVAHTAVGSLRISFLSLARGTVCQSLRLRDGDHNGTDLTLAFDAHVEQPCCVRLSLTDVRLHGRLSARALCVRLEHVAHASFATSSVRPVQQADDDDDDDKGDYAAQSVQWATMGRLVLRAGSLRELAHSRIKVRVLESTARGATALHEHDVGVHELWAALRHAANAVPLTVAVAAHRAMGQRRGSRVRGGRTGTLRVECTMAGRGATV
ncbi:unnamed protein product, partial [Agarophyton chilense]